MKKLKYIRYFFEAIPIYFLYGFFRILPLDAASAFGGWALSKIGPHFKSTKYARINIKLAFPEKNPEEIEKIINGMWNNLGRVLGEFPHLPNIKNYANNERIELVGEEHALPFIKDNKGGILFSGHLGNWEVSSLLATDRGIPLHRIYRHSNNPFVEKLVLFARRSILGELIPKGRTGAKKCIQYLKDEQFLAMLVDQKLNKGVAVPFFGHIAKTAAAPAELAYRYNCPIIPSRVERLKGARFRVSAYPPLILPDTGDKTKNIELVMTEINKLLEGWIRERPEQWLWIHRRWPKEIYKTKES
ncbi:MAG: lauroyl acyltransferase [Alphaproteobacteria bacterium]|nr:lauroyl acyltransferase [Alphaproteobacteria bacterium]